MSLFEMATGPVNTDNNPFTSPEHSWLVRAGETDPQVIQYFLASARCGCFMQAARSLNIRSTHLRKQLAHLEQVLGHSLFCYQGSALVLSREGQQLQAYWLALAHERQLPVVAQPLVRLAVAEPILHDILGRDLIALLRRNALVRLEVIVVDSAASLNTVSADLVLWLAGPGSPFPGPGFVTQAPVLLASLDYVPHIAKRYSRVASRPECLEELTDYMLVQWEHDRQVEAFEPWNNLVAQRLAGAAHVHSYELMLEMIRCSACVGLLPGYMSHFDRGLAPLPGLFSHPMRRDVWMAVSGGADQSPVVQMLVELIGHSFHERREWFG